MKLKSRFKFEFEESVMSRAQVKWTKVEFNGSAKNFSKYEIQLKAALGIEGWTRALDQSFKSEIPASEITSLVETDEEDRRK